MKARGQGTLGRREAGGRPFSHRQESAGPGPDLPHPHGRDDPAHRLAIDDVGAGFSSLRHIVLTAPDVIKMDRSIVDEVSGDPVLTTLVRSLVEFGHGCGARVVAEGVETAQDAASLLGLGVDCGQGWHFGRPGPPEDLRDGVVPQPAVAHT